MTELEPKDYWDEDLEELHKEEIQRQLLRLAIWIEGNAEQTLLDEELARSFHRQVFGSIFPRAAGVVRGERVPFTSIFGPFEGSPHTECERDFANLSRDVVTWQESLDKLMSGNDDVSDSAISVAGFYHVRFIKIHPFANGNGRVVRMCVNHIAARYRLSPIEIDRPNEPEYIETLAAFMKYGKAEYFIDFLRPLMKP